MRLDDDVGRPTCEDDDDDLLLLCLVLVVLRCWSCEASIERLRAPWGIVRTKSPTRKMASAALAKDDDIEISWSMSFDIATHTHTLFLRYLWRSRFRFDSPSKSDTTYQDGKQRYSAPRCSVVDADLCR